MQEMLAVGKAENGTSLRRIKEHEPLRENELLDPLSILKHREFQTNVFLT